MRFPYQASLLPAAIVGLFLVGCGPSKVSQCNKLAASINKANTDIENIRKDTKTDKMAQMGKIASSLDQYAGEIQGIEIKDEKLKGYQTQLVKLYQDMGKGSRDTLTAVQKKDMAAANKAVQVLQTGAVQEKTLIQDVNNYCRS